MIRIRLAPLALLAGLAGCTTPAPPIEGYVTVPGGRHSAAQGDHRAGPVYGGRVRRGHTGVYREVFEAGARRPVHDDEIRTGVVRQVRGRG